MQILVNAAAVFIFSFLGHTLNCIIALLLFKKAPNDTRRVLRFGTIFSNAAFMGLPLIAAILGSEAAIYVSVYLIWFNVFSWSVGCMIYTGDKKYISLKKIIVNPAVMSILVGLLIFLLPIDAWIPEVAVNALSRMQDTVAPMSMMMIGMRLADVKWKGAFKDKYMGIAVFTRLLLLPAIVWAIMRIVALAGWYSDGMTLAVVLLSAATPVAATTSIFAEKFNDNALYASKLVSFSTVLSLITIPLICLLMKI